MKRLNRSLNVQVSKLPSGLGAAGMSDRGIDSRDRGRVGDGVCVWVCACLRACACTVPGCEREIVPCMNSFFPHISPLKRGTTNSVRLNLAGLRDVQGMGSRVPCSTTMRAPYAILSRAHIHNMHTHKKPQSQCTQAPASKPARRPARDDFSRGAMDAGETKRDAPWRELHCSRGNFLLSPIAWRSNIRGLGEVFAMGKVSTEE